MFRFTGNRAGVTTDATSVINDESVISHWTAGGLERICKLKF